VPTYQYQCSACDHAFEVVQSFTDAAITSCPDCGQGVRKVYSNVGIVFKGSGFYKTDSQTKKTESTSPSAAPAAKTESAPTKSD